MSFMRIKIFLLNIFLMGCTVGPRYAPPLMDMPEWHSDIPEEMELISPDCFIWWQSFNDPLLNSLIDRMKIQNLDLQIAGYRLLETRLEAHYGNASLYPHIDAGVNYGNIGYKPQMLNKILGKSCPNRPKNLNFFETGFDAQWEMDLFGMKAHENNSLQAYTEASEQNYLNMEISLTAEIAKNYFELRANQASLEITNKHIHSQTETLQLTADLINTGFLSTIDQMQAQSQLSTLLAQKPQLELGIIQSIHHLSILLGLPPGDLFCELCKPDILPTLPCENPIGIPSELLRRRPDILKAERELAAATENVGVAVAALFPRLSLQGFIGDLQLLGKGGLTWYAGPQLLVPLLNSKLLKQDVKINQYKAEEALSHYRKTVLEALEEAENAISAYRFEKEKNKHLQKALQHSKEAHQLALELYEKGFKNYLEVLQLERLQLLDQEALLKSQSQLLLHYITIYKAIGGSIP